MNAMTDNAIGSSKRDAILEAARKVFLEVGFGATSMDTIASEAKVSKQTVYNHFGSKEDLFAAMIRNSCEQMTLAFAEAAKDGNPEKTLRAIGQLHASFMASDDKHALRRIMMAEVSRFPDLARIYYEAGPELTRKFVAEYLAEQTRLGILKVSNPRITAEQFFSMLYSCRARSEFGVGPPPSDEEVARYIENAVQMLVHAYRV
ncbi:MAG TPA: TetR/AcrR family transcriptional regulator [Gammaproteobacteria bacterium]|jgi:TetR/AcrR family transcriptional repressor of mexJK operon|nr:TetR/AcrR family transcriptional regulator [Gammaproteobacteria bacterium]